MFSRRAIGKMSGCNFMNLLGIEGGETSPNFGIEMEGRGGYNNAYDEVSGF